jgi:multidrug efflux pump subunit AcrB
MSFHSLDQLSLDDETRTGFIAKYFRNIRAVVLISLLLSGIGLMSFLTLPRELNPKIRIPMVFVNTVLPGADSTDVESLVTIPIEDALDGIDGLQKISSTSGTGISTIVLEFASGIDPEKAKADVKSAVDTVSSLPDDAKTPVIQVLDFQNQPVMEIAVTHTGSENSLTDSAQELKRRLKEIPGVREVSDSGLLRNNISITIRPEILTQEHLSLNELSQNIRESLSDLPAGIIGSDGLSLALGMNSRTDSVESLRDLPIRVGERVRPLSEIASITEEPLTTDNAVSAASPRFEPKRAVYLRIFKADTADITVTGEKIKEELARSERDLGLQSSIVLDGPDQIDRQFGDLTRDFLITIGLVLLLLFLFFGIRQSIIAALSIPFTFLVTCTIVQMLGLAINFIVLFSLLIALGILVDNTIVITAAFTSYFRTKKFTPIETALLVFRDFRGVIFATTLTTIWAFVPLLLSTGIIGEFIRAIPIVVSTTLIISAFAAIFLILPIIATLFGPAMPRRVSIFLRALTIVAIIIGILFLVPSKVLAFDMILWVGVIYFGWKLFVREYLPKISKFHRFQTISVFLKNFADHGLLSLDPIALRYEQFILRLLASKKARRKTFVIVVGVALFSYLLMPLGFVINEFFPKTDEDLLFVGIKLPIGTTADQSEEAGFKALEKIQDIPEIVVATAEVGRSIPTDNQGNSSDPNQSLVSIRLTPHQKRARSVFDIEQEVREQLKDFEYGEVSVAVLSGGPPAGSDIEIQLHGTSIETLDPLAESVADYLMNQPGTSNVRITPENGSGKLAFHPDNAMLARQGISKSAILPFLRAGSFEGLTVKDDLRIGNAPDGISVVLKLSPDRFTDPSIFGAISVPNAEGKRVMLSTLGSFSLEPSSSSITREDGKRTLTVSAGLAKNVSVSEANKKLLTFADSLSFPEGYGYTTGGVNEENQKSVRSILLAMVLSSFLIFSTMVLQLGSYRKAMIVLLVIPLAVSGVFFFFALMKIPLSFPALIGVLALFGIVVNNSIIMVDKINKNLDAGMPVDKAVSDGAASRLEPILLTALTTIVGLIPITLSDPVWQGLGGAIIAGLLLSGFMKLFFIPIIYHAWFSERK